MIFTIKCLITTPTAEFQQNSECRSETGYAIIYILSLNILQNFMAKDYNIVISVVVILGIMCCYRKTEFFLQMIARCLQSVIIDSSFFQ